MSAAISDIPAWVWGLLFALLGGLTAQHCRVVGRRARRPACTCGCLRRPDEHQGDGDDWPGTGSGIDEWDSRRDGVHVQPWRAGDEP